MKKNISPLNKYTVSVTIVLFYLVADIILHKGMSRVIIPESFTAKRNPKNFARCDQALVFNSKQWIKAVNTRKKMEHLTPQVSGFEIDVYFDRVKNHLQVYHDSASYSTLKIEDILSIYKTRNLSSSIWLDFKNLSALNEKQSLHYISVLRKNYNLQNKLIVESSSPQFLQSFCDSGFFTSYYTPYFNPYLITEGQIITIIDSISGNIKKFPTSALSGYYFQYPMLKKFFPNYPVLIWADKNRFSLVSSIFNNKLLDDGQVKVVLYPN